MILEKSDRRDIIRRLRLTVAEMSQANIRAALCGKWDKAYEEWLVWKNSSSEEVMERLKEADFRLREFDERYPDAKRVQTVMEQEGLL